MAMKDGYILRNIMKHGKNRIIHAIRSNPYVIGWIDGEKWSLYQSLCGIKNPSIYNWNERVLVTCRRCLKILKKQKDAKDRR